MAYVDPRRQRYRDSKTGGTVLADPSGPVSENPRFTILSVAQGVQGSQSSPGTTPKGGSTYDGGTTFSDGTRAPLGGTVRAGDQTRLRSGSSMDSSGGVSTRRSISSQGESSMFGSDPEQGGSGVGFGGLLKKPVLGFTPNQPKPLGGVGVLGGEAYNFATQGVLGAVPTENLSPEAQASRRLGEELNLADETLRLGEKNFADTLNLAGEQTQSSIGDIKETAQLGMTQAEREKELALGQQDIDKMKADKEFEAAIAQQEEFRAQENEYLMQKLASAGAIDSTAGVQIITKSAQKYDSIIGGLQGDRQIALAQFAQNDAVIRNSYMSAVETIASNANNLISELTKNFQTLALGASQQLGQVGLESTRQKQNAINSYYDTLNGIRSAQAEAEREAANAVLEAQQRAFENAIKLAGLTGTYIDPTTGEAIRTINGIKLDRESSRGGSGGKSLSGSESALIQDIVRSALASGGSPEAAIAQYVQQYFTGAKQEAAYNAAFELLSAPNARKIYKAPSAPLGQPDSATDRYLKGLTIQQKEQELGIGDSGGGGIIPGILGSLF